MCVCVFVLNNIYCRTLEFILPEDFYSTLNKILLNTTYIPETSLVRNKKQNKAQLCLLVGKIIIPWSHNIFRNLQSNFSYIVYLILRIHCEVLFCSFSGEENKVQWGRNCNWWRWPLSSEFPNLLLFYSIFTFFLKYKYLSIKFM